VSSTSRDHFGGRASLANAKFHAPVFHAATQTATLRGPNRTVTLRVPDPKQFQMIAVGDQVQITYTEAVAVSVEPAPKK
jgi:hypothetical protein